MATCKPARKCAAVDIGSLTERVTIQAVTEAEDAYGTHAASWGTFATVWAAFEPLKAYEKYQAAQLQTPVTHKVTMRYLSGLTTKHRILWGTRVFNIVEVINVNEQDVLHVLKAVEGSPA